MRTGCWGFTTALVYPRSRVSLNGDGLSNCLGVPVHRGVLKIHGRGSVSLIIRGPMEGQCCSGGFHNLFFQQFWGGFRPALKVGRARV